MNQGYQQLIRRGQTVKTIDLGVPPTIEDALGTAQERNEERQARLAQQPLAHLPDVPHSLTPAESGCTVSRWSDGTVHVVDDTTKQGLAFAPFLAIDVAQRMISMAMLILQDEMRAMQATRTVAQKPQIDIVRAHLPKGMR